MRALSGEVRASVSLPRCPKLEKELQAKQERSLVNCRRYISAAAHGNVISSAVSRGERAKEEGSRHVCHAEPDGIPCTGFHYSPDTPCI